MAATKKDFEVLATAMARAKPQDGCTIIVREPNDILRTAMLKAMDVQWQEQIRHLCEALRQINPRFREETFTDWINDEGRRYAGK